MTRDPVNFPVRYPRLRRNAWPRNRCGLFLAVLLAGSGPLAPALSFVCVVLLGILVFHGFPFCRGAEGVRELSRWPRGNPADEVAAKLLRN